MQEEIYLISCPGEKSVPVASIETIKFLWNTVISSQGAKHCAMDLKCVLLKLCLLEHVRVRMLLSKRPPEFAKARNLCKLVDDKGFCMLKLEEERAEYRKQFA